MIRKIEEDPILQFFRTQVNERVGSLWLRVQDDVARRLRRSEIKASQGFLIHFQARQPLARSTHPPADGSEFRKVASKLCLPAYGLNRSDTGADGHRDTGEIVGKVFGP